MLVHRIAERWSGMDRGDAIDWASGLTDPDEQAAAYRSVAAGWMSEDSHRASAWISTLPLGKPRDAAVLAMAQQVASTDPDLSWQWGLTMTDPGLRTQALGHAARAWSRLDGAALQTALADPVLIDGDRAAIANAMQSPQVEAADLNSIALSLVLMKGSFGTDLSWRTRGRHGHSLVPASRGIFRRIPVKPAVKSTVVRPAKLASSASSPLLKAWKEATATQGGFGERLALMAMVMRATSEEMPLLLAQSEDNRFARELLILRWVEIDADAAGEWISPALREPNASGHAAKARDILQVLSAWAKRDPDAAMAKLKAAGGDFTASQYQSQIIGSVLAEDMERGLKLMTEIKPRANSTYFDSAWVKKDPAKAARLLSELPESEFRNDSLVRAMGELGAKDMAAGLALLEKFPGLSSTRQQYSGYGVADSRAALFEQWAKQDMTAMIAFANDHAQGATRSSMKEAIAKVIGEGDPKVAFSWAADNLSGQRRQNVVNSLLTKLAKEKPAEALEYVVSLPPGTALEGAVNTYAKATSDEDPASALARVQSLPEGPARTRLLAASYLAWYGKDPAAALSEITSQPSNSLPRDLWGSLGSSSRSIELGLKQIDQIPAELAPDFIRGVFTSPGYVQCRHIPDAQGH